MRTGLIMALVVAAWGHCEAIQAEQPNILWLTAEDMGPHLGCYGDSYAETPHLDAFARKGIRYLNAWSNAPVCAPARTTLISGLYPSSTGSENMRSRVPFPASLSMYPTLLQQSGYYCINPGKTDYNLIAPKNLWNKTNKQNPWPDLKSHQPFMAVFNYTGTHESQIRTRPHAWKHDPAKAPVPPYHPDTKEVREDWAQYYDNITEMDGWFAEKLQQLDEQGLTDNTIVFFYGDHGSGMSRNKRWLYNSGLRVPLLIFVPEKFRHLVPADSPVGGTSRRLVSFVDFAPSLVSLAGAEIPATLQGNSFLGTSIATPQRYLFGFRGRMDERIDLSRTVRTERYHYIRNYMPHRIYGAYLAYMFETPSTQKWYELFQNGQLNEAQSQFWKRKPPEELYDLQSDPDEIQNIIASPEHQDILNELRQAHINHVMQIRDIGFLQEAELHTRAPQLSPYDLGHDDQLYPLAEIFRMAELASMPTPDIRKQLAKGLAHTDSGVRYWAAMGYLNQGTMVVQGSREQLREVILHDPSYDVRTIAAEALARYGASEDLPSCLDCLIEAADPEKHGPYTSLLALNAIDHLGTKVRPIEAQLKRLPREGTGTWTPRQGWNYPGE